MTTILVTVLLLAANAFFVGAEFAAMSARRSQLEPLAEQGSTGARVALDALQRTGILLATSQLGITVCSVLLGAVSEAALHHALVPVAEALGLSEVVADAVALVLALAIVVFLHVVYGEMIPKNISIARSERAAVVLVPPLVMVSRVVAPVIRAMDWLSKALIRLFGVEPKDEVASAFTAEEVAHILDESRHEGLVEDEHYERLGAALEFSDKDAGPPGNSVCFSGWKCQHLWTQIANMVAFRNTVVGTDVNNWWDNGYDAIAFGRGTKGFVAINRETFAVSSTFQTALPAGTYCNVQENGCVRVTVDSSGRFTTTLGAGTALALHVNAR